jgi:hypothetical protein
MKSPSLEKIYLSLSKTLMALCLLCAWAEKLVMVSLALLKTKKVYFFIAHFYTSNILQTDWNHNSLITNSRN